MSEFQDVFEMAFTRTIGKSEYVLLVECINCRFSGYVTLDKGIEFPTDGRCPQCECRTVSRVHGG